MRTLILGAAVVVVGLVGCPPPTECSSPNECALDQVCNVDGKCVPKPTPTPLGEGEGEGNIIPGGEGEGEGNILSDVFINDPITMFQRDPANSNLAVIGSNGSFDVVQRMNLLTGELDTSLAFDFKTLAVPCNGVDSILGIANALPLALPSSVDETLFACPAAPKLMYGQDFGGEYDTTMAPYGLVRLLLEANNDGIGTPGRLITAARGGTQLVITALKNDGSDQINAPRPTEPVNVTFTEIGGFFVVRAGDPQFGDVLLVFDRGTTPPKLIPIQREFGLQTWHGAPIVNASPLFVSIALPTGTWATIFEENPGIPDLQALGVSDPDVFNIVTVQPLVSNGVITFQRYESEAQAAGSSPNNVMRTLFASGQPAALPLKTDRVLFEEVKSAGTFFFGLTNTDFAVRFPVQTPQDADKSGEILRAQFLHAGVDKPSAMIVAGDAAAWFSIKTNAGLNELQLIPFVANF